MEESSNSLLLKFEQDGCEEVIAAALESLLDAAPRSWREAIQTAVLMGRDGEVDLIDTWNRYIWLVNIQPEARRVADAGDKKAGLSEAAAKRIYFESRLVPAFLLGHSLSAWRLNRHAAAMVLFHNASELIHAARAPGTIRGAISRDARIKASKVHAENRDLKAQAIAYYRDHRHEFPSKDKAAQFIAERIVPLKVRTVRDYLTGI